MDNVASKLCYVSKVTLLAGGPRRRRTEKGGGQRLVISEQGKFAGFEEKAEMANGGVSCQEFTVKGRIFGLGGG